MPLKIYGKMQRLCLLRQNNTVKKYFVKAAIFAAFLFYINIVKFLRNKLLMFAKGKTIFCMRNFIVLCFVLCSSSASFSQTIKRENMNETELGGLKIFAKIHSNIFNDFSWIEPEFSSKKIDFFDHIYYFEMNGISFQLTQVDSNMMELKGSGTSILIDKKKSENDIYFDKKILKQKAIENQKWIAYPSAEKKSIAVKHLSPGSTNNYYMSFESHSIVTTKWNWETTSDSVLSIPSYIYYRFDLNDGRTIFVYEIKNNLGKFEFYIQNASYLDATDDKGIEYILLDNNCNGNYTDETDKIFFKTWNPNLKNSRYKKLKFAKENTWYGSSFFHDNFLIPYFHEGKLNFENIIENYTGINKTGIVKFKNVPKKSTLLINKTKYPINKGNNNFACEYGIYKSIISCDGCVDFDSIFTINDNNPLEEILYPKKAVSGGTIEIKNIFETDFFATVKNVDGYCRTYHNANKIAVPTGNNEVTIYFDGYEISTQFSIKQNEIHGFDFENYFETDFERILKKLPH